MTTYTFGEVAVWGHKTGKCGCGKRRDRREKFWQTLNSFNRTADGTPKTREQIEAELVAQRDAWVSQPITCATCKGGLRVAALPPPAGSETGKI